MKKVSVIIPTYKTGDYIYQCIDSLEKQTLSKHDFEVLIILNGEKEPYYSKIKNYLETNNIDSKLFYTEVCGVSNARNIGLDNSQGENICFVDDDDWVSPYYLQNLHKLINSDCIAISNIIKYDEKKQNYTSSSYTSKLKFNKKVPVIKYRSYLSNCGAKMIPISMINEKRFNTNFQNSEDALFMFSISDKLKYFNISDKDSIYYIRRRSNSLSRVISISKSLINAINFVSALTNVYIHNLSKYSFILFLTRMVAPLKLVIHRIISKSKKDLKYDK